MAQQLIMYHLMDCYAENPVPEGFRIRNFRPGEEAIWVEINKCGIFGPNVGMDGWESMIVKMKTIVPERDIFFATLADDVPAATLTAYVREDGLGSIHMVTAKESVRGHGIGKALLWVGMKKLKETVPLPPYTRLSTDDWRLAAIKGYLGMGFHPVNIAEDMPDRWQKVCDNLNFHGVTMLDPEGKPTDIVL